MDWIKRKLVIFKEIRELLNESYNCYCVTNEHGRKIKILELLNENEIEVKKYIDEKYLRDIAPVKNITLLSNTKTHLFTRECWINIKDIGETLMIYDNEKGDGMPIGWAEYLCRHSLDDNPRITGDLYFYDSAHNKRGKTIKTPLPHQHSEGTINASGPIIVTNFQFKYLYI
jgi:hypothetical protein